MFEDKDILCFFEDFTDSTPSMKDNFSIMVWNAQGAGNIHFLNTLREVIRRYDPKILALVEVKISGQ